MKNTIITLAFLFIAINTPAQNSLEISGNFNYFGRSISGMYHIKHRENQSFAVGLNANINTIAHPDDQGKVYFKRLYATKLIHYFGLRGSYYWYPKKLNLKSLKAFLFIDGQATYSTTRNSMFSPEFELNGNTYYAHHIENFGPFLWYSQSVGFGIEVPITDKISMKQLIGYGVGFTFGYDKKLYERLINRFGWEFAQIINIGFCYHLK